MHAPTLIDVYYAECCWGSALAIQVTINQELYRKKHMAVFIANKIESSREVL